MGGLLSLEEEDRERREEEMGEEEMGWMKEGERWGEEEEERGPCEICLREERN